MNNLALPPSVSASALDERPTFLDGHKRNFDTLMRAFHAGDAALLHCTDKETGKPVAVIVAVNRHEEDVDLVPFAAMFDGNPYEQLDPPSDLRVERTPVVVGSEA